MHILYKIINAKIHTVTKGIIQNGYVSISDGKIQEVGDMSACKISKAEDIVDLNSYLLFPGFIDVHTHIGLLKEGQSENYNKNKQHVNPLIPEYNVISDIDISDIAFDDAVNAGITTVVVSPTSTEVIAGQACALKTFGNDIGKRILLKNACLKIALGENPINFHKKNETSNYSSDDLKNMIIQIFNETLNYINNSTSKEQKYEILKEALINKLPVFFHAHNKEDITVALEISNKFHLNYAIIHASESHLMLDKLKKSSCNIIQGPFFTNRSKQELLNMDMKTSAILHKNSLLSAITTDHPELPIQFLSTCAAFAHKHGLNINTAIKMITINPAKLCGIDNKVGSIEKGKHADIIVFKNEPIANPFEEPVLVIGGGEILKCEL